MTANPATIPYPAAPRILAVANQKGGVGKTTTTINLGTALAAVGETVLIVDIDPQGNASTGLGIDRSARNVSTYHVLTEGAALSHATIPTRIPRLSVAPSTLDLLGAEMELAALDNRAAVLREALGAMISDPDEGFLPPSYVLIDCPPSLNLLTVNALVAAHAVLVPLQCEFFALEGLTQLLNTVAHIGAGLNEALHVQGIVLTMYDRRNKLSEQVAADVRGHLGDLVYDTVIPRNVRISEAPSHGKPALLYDLKCAGSQAYLRLASEIIRRERQARHPVNTLRTAV